MKRTLIALALASGIGAYAQPSQSMLVFQPALAELASIPQGETYRRSVKAAPGLDPATLNAIAMLQSERQTTRRRNANH